MTRSTARRWAEAAFQIAERDGTTDAWLAALAEAERRLGDPPVARLLANPAIPYPARREVAEAVLGDAVLGPPRHLVLLLLRRGRIELLPAVARELRRLHHLRQGITEATVTSAAPLSEAEVAVLGERLAGLSGGQVEMRLEVDPGLLGGLRVRLGDRLIDGSVRGRLERLRNSLSSTAASTPPTRGT